jgi:DNA-binding NarL/FixJ family response regulator
MKLLIVDESVEVRTRLAAMLSELHGLRILKVGGIAMGKELLNVSAPDILVMDFRFPGGASAELLGLAKSRVPSVTVLVTSNHTQYRDYCLHLGADAFFDKSLEFEALAELLTSMTEVSPS